MSDQTSEQELQSKYDEILGDEYEAQPLTIDTAITRAGSVTINLEELEQEVVSPDQGINLCQTDQPTIYPPYRIDYTPGEKIKVLPHDKADPEPVEDQYLYTSEHTYDNFNVADLPDVLFYLEAPRDPLLALIPNNADNDVPPVPMIVDASTNDYVRNREGVPLRYFSFLPRYIGSKVHAMLLEFWFRLDSRLEANDIVARRLLDADDTSAQSRGKGKADEKRDPFDQASNAISMQRTRARETLMTMTWINGRASQSKTDIELIGKLTPLQICFNTSMLVDLHEEKLYKPCFSNHGRGLLTGYVDSGLPLDHFLRDMATAIPSRRMIGGMLLRKRMQALALQEGLARSFESWKNLDDDLKPVWWIKASTSAIGTAITQIDGLTHAEYMDMMVGNGAYMEGRPKRVVTRGWHHGSLPPLPARQVIAVQNPDDVDEDGDEEMQLPGNGVMAEREDLGASGR